MPPLKEFVDSYLSMKLKMNWHHRFFYDILSNDVIQQEDHKIYINEDKKVNKNILMLAPRFHAKSQCFTINYPIWEIYKNPNVRIIIVSANEDIAVSFNRAIMNQLENNQQLIDDFGYIVPTFIKKWSERAMIVKRNSSEKDPTVAAIGVGGKLISRRADIIIADDIIDIDTARTKAMRNKTREWFENVLLPILEDDGRLIVAGTAWYKDDIYDTLYSSSDFDIRVRLKALIWNEKFQRERKGHPETRYLPYKISDFPQALRAQELFSDKAMQRYKLYDNLRGGVLWWEKWSFDKLMSKKKNMSNSSFMRQYLNEPSTEEEKLFKKRYIDLAKNRGSHKTLLPSWDNLERHEYGYGQLVVAIGLDLAISQKKDSDDTAVSVWGLAENRDRILLYLERGKWTPDETKQRILDLYYAFKPIKIVVENVAFQDMMRQALAAEDIPVEGFHTTQAKKYSEETGIANIALLLEQEKVLIPSGQNNQEYSRRVNELLAEMSVYSYDQHAGDYLASTWFAFHALNDFDKKMKENRGFFATNALVEQIRQMKAAHRVVILGYNPPFYKRSFTSLLYVFRELPERNQGPFIEPGEKFFIFATREQRSIAYIIEKRTSEIVAKLDGDISAIMWTTLLEKAAFFFNNAQIIIDRNGEGDAIYTELIKRNYPKLLCMQPDKDGHPTMGDGFVISPSNLPLAIDHLRQIVDGIHIRIPDEMVVKEMSELISSEGDKLTMSFGTGQRIKTLAVALWLLDEYENYDKKLYNDDDNKKKIRKKLNTPYLIFK